MTKPYLAFSLAMEMTSKFIRSRDVVFHENQTTRDSNKEEQQS